jgi:hypothetical protein
MKTNRFFSILTASLAIVTIVPWAAPGQAERNCI